MWLLYQLLVLCLSILAIPFGRSGRGKHYLTNLRRRLSGYPEAPDSRYLWFHAVSVGEAGVATTLVRALPDSLPILVTTVTATGQERAHTDLLDRGLTAYLPPELGWVVRKFLDHFRPLGLVLVEGDLWPLVLRHVTRRGIPVYLVNGRVSERTFRRLKRIRPLARKLYAYVDRFGMQTEGDKRRLLSLGVPEHRIEVTGNLKFETPEPQLEPKLERLFKAVARKRAIFVAGSTMPGEEEQVLESMRGLGDRALLILAPRHPERWSQVEELVRTAGVDCALRSQLSHHSRSEVVLLDTLGELAALYRIATGAFIGGTLVPTGGHNPIEPARFGVPVVVGRHMENFRQIAEAFDGAHAWARVENANDLAEVWSIWLARAKEAQALGAVGARLVEQSRGAMEHTLRLLAPLLEAQTTELARSNRGVQR